jgi:hypothetical protein
MLIQRHDTDCLIEPHTLPLVGDTWATAVVPRLPADLAEQARVLKAFPRVRGLATPQDLLRGGLAYVLGPWSTRRLGAWAVLMGLADLSEAAWRKRLRASNAWLLWLRSERIAVPAPSAPGVPRLAGRLLVVDASCLRQPGGTADDGRLPLADDFLAGRMSQGQVTDRRGGERLERYRWPAGDVIVAENGSGYRRSGAWAGQQQADIIVRLPPATCPRETAAGEPLNVWRWLRQRGHSAGAWQRWCRWPQQRYRVRLIAAKCAAQTAQRARVRRRRKAPKAGRASTAPPLLVAGWLLRSTPLEAVTGSAADGLSV